MKAIERLKERLEHIGATLDVDPWTMHADAPNGYVWSANQCTCLAIPYANNGQTWTVEAIKEATGELAAGLDKVTDPDELARHRHDLGEDDWGAPNDAPERIEWR